MTVSSYLTGTERKIDAANGRTKQSLESTIPSAKSTEKLLQGTMQKAITGKIPEFLLFHVSITVSALRESIVLYRSGPLIRGGGVASRL